MIHYIGVDGGGTKTECILVDESGAVRARHLTTGTNPSSVGAEAEQVLLTALRRVRAEAGLSRTAPTMTLLCMAGSLGYWAEIANRLDEFGDVKVFDDSLPVLELATGGRPGLVLHAGTGSFVAARDRAGAAHYAGGLGWRFGDQGSGYDLGRRAVAQVLLERQGWAKATLLGDSILKQVGKTEYTELIRLFYGDPNANRLIAGLAPLVIDALAQGDSSAMQIALASTGELLDFGVSVATRLFGDYPIAEVSVGVSGRILTNPTILGALQKRAPFRLHPVRESPAEGVRRMLLRLGGAMRKPRLAFGGTLAGD